MTYSIIDDEDEQTLRANLEKRYGEPVAQQILEEIGKASQGEIELRTDYMEIKELSELAERFRTQAIEQIQQLKAWRAKEDARNSTSAYIALEGEFLAKQVGHSLYLYRQVRSHYFASYRAAMGELEASQYHGYQCKMQKRAAA